MNLSNKISAILLLTTFLTIESYPYISLSAISIALLLNIKKINSIWS